jgi:hypothetical protein
MWNGNRKRSVAETPPEVIDLFNATNGKTVAGENNFLDPNPANNIYLKPFLTIDLFVTRIGLRFTL